MLNKDDGIFLPSIEGVVSGKTSQVAGMNEILNKLIGNDNYLDKGKMSTENTIADLKNSKKYKLGDVVEILGFHAKGDGSHHKRIAKDKDDGSGELGQNGIWWCIVHSGEVCFSMFGALFNKNNDYEFIKKALKYCDDNGVNIKIRKKSDIYFIGQLETKSSIDFGNSTIYVDDNNKNSKITFVPDTDFESINLEIKSMNNKQTYYWRTNMLDTNSVVMIEDGNKYCTRYDTTPVDFYRKELLLYTLRDSFEHPPIADYANMNNVSYYHRKLNPFGYLKNFTITADMSQNIEGFLTFQTSRDNFTFENIIIDPSLDTMVLDTGFKGSLFSAKNCYGVSFKNILGNNIAGIGVTTSGRAGYIINTNNVSNLYFENVRLSGAWGAIGQNMVNKSLAVNCSFNRYDVHLYSKDLTFRDCNFYDFGIMASDTYGDVVVENCKYYTNAREFAGALFTNAGSYGAYNPSNFYFRNIELCLRQVKPMISISVSSQENQFKGSRKIGNITIDNVIITSRYPSNTPLQVVEINQGKASETYEVSDINLKNIDFTPITNNMVLMSSNVDGLVTSNINVNIENCKFTTAFDGTHKYTDFYPEDTKSTYVPNEKIPRTFRNILKIVANMSVKNSEMFIVHDSFNKLFVENSKIATDLITGTAMNDSLDKIIFSNSEVFLLPTGSDITVGIYGFDALNKKIINSKIDLLKFTDITPTSVQKYFSVRNLMNGVRFSDSILATTGEITAYVNSKNNYVFKNINEDMMVTFTQLDTPYYTRKMEEEGIYADYVAYRDELHEYEKAQSQIDETMLLPVLHEPVIPESIKQFAEKYKLT